MARMSAQSRSPRDAGGGRAQRCAPSAREFWRRRRVREECRRAPLAGGGRGKFSGAGAAVPATAIGIQPCNQERCPTGRGEQSSLCRHRPTPGQNSAARSALSMPIHQGSRPARKGLAGFVDDRNSRPLNGSNTSGEQAARPGRTAEQQRKRLERNPNGTRPAGFRPRRREPRSDPPATGACLPKTAAAVTPTAWCAAAR